MTEKASNHPQPTVNFAGRLGFNRWANSFGTSAPPGQGPAEQTVGYLAGDIVGKVGDDLIVLGQSNSQSVGMYNITFGAYYIDWPQIGIDLTAYTRPARAASFVLGCLPGAYLQHPILRPKIAWLTIESTIERSIKNAGPVSSYARHCGKDPVLDPVVHQLVLYALGYELLWMCRPFTLSPGRQSS